MPSMRRCISARSLRISVPSASAGSSSGLVVEGFDLLGDGEVFVGDGAVGDAGVNHGHPHRSVSEQGGDRFEGHAPVDGLGGQRVSEVMGGDVADAGGVGGFGDGSVDALLADRPAVFENRLLVRRPAGRCGEPVVEELL